MSVSKICCIGADYIGGPVGSIIALKCPEIKVTVTDTNEEKIMQWNSEKPPVFEPGLDDVVKKCRNKNLFFTTDMTAPIKEADIIFVCGDTPMKSQGVGRGKAADLKFLEDAARLIADVAESSKIIVEKSTVPMRAAETLETILKANQRPGRAFQVLSSPEFLSEGSAVHDLLHPERILIGGNQNPQSFAAIEQLKSVYEHWVPRDRIITTDCWSTELSKLATNAFLAQRISSINSLSEVCEMTNADISDVSVAIGMDTRLGNKCMEPSLGFGGPNFRKDILNMVYLCESLNLPQIATYWQKILDINEYQRKRFTKKVIETFFNTLTDKRLAVLGFAFKRETRSTEDSPAIGVCKTLLEEGAHLNIYDPVVPKDQILENLNSVWFGEEPVMKLVNVFDDPYSAVEGTHGIVVCTDWSHIIKLNYDKVYDAMKKPAYVFDGHNKLPHKELIDIGFIVSTVGKNLNANDTPAF